MNFNFRQKQESVFGTQIPIFGGILFLFCQLRISLERLGNISVGTRFKYKCNGDRPMGFVCVRNEDGKHTMARCTDENGKCKTFERDLIEPAHFNFQC